MVGIALLFLVQLLITFRGLSSPAAMDQAQMAREIARGNFFQTQVVRPFAWYQQREAGKEVNPLAMVDTRQPPLPSLLLAPVFKGLEAHWNNTPQNRVYVLDRVVAAISLLFLLGAMGMTQLTVERLFDAKIANWTVLIMAGCQLLWDVATGSLAPMMLLFFFSTALFLLVLMHERLLDGKDNQAGFAFGIGILAALMVFTHWMALWLIPGLLAAVFYVLRPRVAMILAVAPLLGALVFWMARNVELTGDFAGTAKATLQGLLLTHGESFVQRNFADANALWAPEMLTRHLLHYVIQQFGGIYQFLGAALPAVLFFAALLHPFRKEETRSLSHSLAIMWLGAFIGMCFTGVKSTQIQDQQLHYLFIPLFTAYGLAFLFVLWARIPVGQRNTRWSRHGIAVIAFTLSLLPMLHTLPNLIVLGIRNKGMMAYWPPYLPERLAELKTLTGDNELLVSDMPWAVAWYADRPCLWLPREPAQLEEMRKLMTENGQTVAGLVITPWSASGDSINAVLRNEYQPWASAIYLGTGSSLGVDTLTPSSLPFRELLVLAGEYSADGRVLAEILFLSDRKRWEQ